MLLDSSTPFSDSVLCTLRPPCAAGKRLLTDSAFQKDHRLVSEGTATHAGMIINRRVYRPYRVSAAARTMYDPAPIPFVVGHAPVDNATPADCRAVGTIQLAQYVDTRRGRPEDSVITKWDANAPADSLGHLRYWGHIDDPDTITRVLDGRLNRQSVGFYTDQMIDSVTGIDLYKAELEDWPSHVLERKNEVDGKLAFLVPGKLSYYHLAFTDEPADPWAGIDAFKTVPSEIQEAHGKFQIYAQDSEDHLIYDMSDPDAVKHFRKPIWALGFDFDARRAGEVDRIRKEKLLAVSTTGDSHIQEPGSLPAPDLPSQDGPDAKHEADDPMGAASADTRDGAPTDTVPAVTDEANSIGSEGDREVPSIHEEATMDKILEMIKALGVATDRVVADLIVKLGLGEDQIRSLEPVAKILQTDAAAAEQGKTAAVEAAQAAAKTEVDRISGELKSTQDKVTAFETARQTEMVNRMYDAQVKLGIYKAAELDSEDKVKAIKADLAKQSTDSLEFSLRSLERIQGPTQKTEVTSTVPKRTGAATSATDSDTTPRFMKNQG